MLSLETIHKSHLEKLNAFDADFTAEFCKLALQTLLVHGDLARNEKLYVKAASRLNSDATVVKECVEALTALFKIAARKGLVRLQETLVLTNLPQSLVDTIAESYSEVHRALNQHLRLIQPVPVSYRGLEWRLGAVVASRAERATMKPRLTLQFSLVDCNGQCNKVNVECSIDNLRKMRDVLEEVLQAARTRKVRKLTRMLT
ncbi:COMM domain-containing protein 2-like [Tropilaelaps mercedesae]|uniref:COMM domain-containing protein 2-like n=1 Tax=Tropilaelaps mercedesae TaxID=418985 RepID=A0A1V9XIZ3_9ACAR|nr:COMM domain-containing protein 2-like [Tropilaelaps mercedesae]